MDPFEAFDHLVIFNDDEFKKLNPDSSVSLDEVVDNVIPDLIEALEDRTLLVLKVNIPFGSQKHFHGIGLKLNGQRANRVLTKGPQSDSEEGNAFRLFWSKKAELRRIDGDLHECVMWSAEENVCKQIINFVLNKRSGPIVSSIRMVWHHITPDLLNIAVLRTSSSTPSTSSARLVCSMDKLRSLLRGLNTKLPLNITGILPVSSDFRDTSVFPSSLSIPPTARVERKRKIFHRGGMQLVEDDELAAVQSPLFPLYVVVTLEQSGRWPSELEAFKHMKQLLVIRIHELLSPLGVPSHVTQDSMLDVYLDGLVFRVSIAQPRELQLLQSSSTLTVDTSPTDISVDEKPTPDRFTYADKRAPVPRVDTVASLAWRRLNQSTPLIAGLLASVSRDHAHVFPAACRLAKRWLSVHGCPVILCPYEAEQDGVPAGDAAAAIADRLLTSGEPNLSAAATINGGRMSEIAVELLVVYAAGFCYQPVVGEEGHKKRTITAVGANPTSSIDRRLLPAGSPVAAFLRFLGLLSKYDWDSKPLLVDLNEGFGDAQKRIEALHNFQSMRKALPTMVLATPVDLMGADWTAVGPTRRGLKDIQLLANQSCRLLRAMLVGGAHCKDLQAIFCPAFQRMDVVLNLKSHLLHVRAAEAVNLTKCERKVADSLPSEIPPPGARFWPVGYCYDPVQYVIHLIQCQLGKYCHIYWDRHGGNWIGLKWRHVPDWRPFSRAFLDGLSVHDEMITSDGGSSHMLLRRQLDSLVKLLPQWGAAFLQSVQLVAETREARTKAVRAVSCRVKRRKFVRVTQAS